MFGIDYLLGYSQGRSSAEDERDTNALVARVLYGQRPVQVDQSYLDQLHRLMEEYRCNSIHNFDKSEQFYTEALAWKEKALRFEGDAKALRAQNAALQAELAERASAVDHAQATIAQERALHQTTHEEKWGLNLFRLMATWLIEAHSAGRSDRPEFAELRDMAKDVTDAIQRGNPFRGYRDEPEKKTRLETLVAALDRP